MTVLEKKVASGVDGTKLRQSAVVAILAAALGAGAVLGIRGATGSDALSPAQIEQIRSAELADHMQSQWIAEVDAAKRVARIQEQRAADMAEYRYGEGRADR